MLTNSIEVITLFVTDISACKAFYQKVFAPQVLFEDDASAVLQFSSLMINLLDESRAPTLVTPLSVAPAAAGSRMLLTIRVKDVDTVCANLKDLGIELLNGPIDRPWGRRTAAFADPSGHVWEVAHLI